MKVLKVSTTILMITILVSCSKDSVENDQENGEFAFLPDSHTNIVFAEANYFGYMNDHRETMGLEPIEWDIDIIKKYSNSHTEYMIEKREVSKDNYENMISLLLDEVKGGQAEINVAIHKEGEGSGLDIFHYWIADEDARKNIEGNWTYSAVSVKIGDDRNYYVTQLFVKIQ